MGKRILAKKGGGRGVPHSSGLTHSDGREEAGHELLLTACGDPGAWSFLFLVGEGRSSQSLGLRGHKSSSRNRSWPRCLRLSWRTRRWAFLFTVPAGVVLTDPERLGVQGLCHAGGSAVTRHLLAQTRHQLTLRTELLEPKLILPCSIAHQRLTGF